MTKNKKILDEKSKEDLKSLLEMSKPLIDYLKNNYYPYGIVVVTTNGATVYNGELGVVENEEGDI